MANNPLATAHGIVSVQIAETGISPVAAGGDQFGWVSGTPVGLAMNASTPVIFDLGPLWYKYTVCQLSAIPDSANLINVQIYSSDTPAINTARRLNYGNAGNFGYLLASVAVGQPSSAMVRSMGRYLVISIQNDVAVAIQGINAKITLAAYPS